MEYSRKQRRGTEFGGTSQENTVQPRDSWETLSPSEQARLIKTTGQDRDPAAKPSRRAWNGQTK